MRLSRLAFAFREKLRIAAARLRVHRTRLQGGRDIHPKCLFDRDVRVDRPWTVRMGARCVLQQSVWLSMLAEQAQLEIGEYTFIERGTEIQVSDSVRIGKYGLIGPGVFIPITIMTPRLARQCFARPVRPLL